MGFLFELRHAEAFPKHCAVINICVFQNPIIIFSPWHRLTGITRMKSGYLDPAFSSTVPLLHYLLRHTDRWFLTCEDFRTRLCNTTKGRTSLRKDVEPQTRNLIYQTNFFVSVLSNLCPLQTTAYSSSNINFVKLACQPLSTALCRHASCPIQHPGGQALIISMHPSVLSEESVPKHKSCSCLMLI